jgi:hypothetical protein
MNPPITRERKSTTTMRAQVTEKASIIPEKNTIWEEDENNKSQKRGVHLVICYIYA